MNRRFVVVALVAATLLVAPERLQLLVRVTEIVSGIVIHADALQQSLDTWSSVRTRIDGPTWFAGLDAGRTFVSNGPALDFTVNGQLPGSEIEVNSKSYK